MAIEVTRAIEAVTRELYSPIEDGSPARVLIAQRAYSTTREDLWNALTDAERIPRWLLPITGDLHEGGHYQLRGNAGGKILVCKPAIRLGVTWGMHGQVS